jgi:hypothetical protein
MKLYSHLLQGGCVFPSRGDAVDLIILAQELTYQASPKPEQVELIIVDERNRALGCPAMA